MASQKILRLISFFIILCLALSLITGCITEEEKAKILDDMSSQSQSSDTKQSNDNVIEDKSLDGMEYVTTENLNFRENPTIESNSLELVPRDTVVMVVDFLDYDWYKVSYNGKVGYMKAEYLSELNPKDSSYTPERPKPTDNTLAEQIIGKWTLTDSSSRTVGYVVAYDFKEDGRVIEYQDIYDYMTDLSYEISGNVLTIILHSGVRQEYNIKISDDTLSMTDDYFFPNGSTFVREFNMLEFRASQAKSALTNVLYNPSSLQIHEIRYLSPITVNRAIEEYNAVVLSGESISYGMEFTLRCWGLFPPPPTYEGYIIYIDYSAMNLMGGYTRSIAILDANGELVEHGGGFKTNAEKENYENNKRNLFEMASTYVE